MSCCNHFVFTGGAKIFNFFKSAGLFMENHFRNKEDVMKERSFYAEEVSQDMLTWF